MFSKKIGSSKNRVKIIYFILAVFMVILVLRTPIDKFIEGMGMLVLPIKTKIYQASNSIKSSLQSIANYNKMVKENKKLKFQLAKNRQLLARFKHVETENDRLRALLEMKQEKRLDFMVANISFRDGFSVYSEMYIDKGSKQGIKKNMVVLNNENLLGRVKEVYSDSSLVELVTKTDIYTSVLDQNNKNLSILKGVNSKQLELEYITVDSDTKEGDEVYTSGLSDIYPKGIYVGKIKEVVEDKNRLFKKVVLELPYNIFDINEVIILK